MSVTFFGNKVFASIINLRISSEIILDLGRVLNPMVNVLTRERRG